MASLIAIWCWGNELYPSAIGPQPPADRLLPGVALTHGNSMSVFPMENFPLPPLVQTQVWLNSTGVGISNGKFSIATLGSDSGLAEFNRRVNSNGKFSIVTQA